MVPAFVRTSSSAGFTNYIQTFIENHFIPTISNATQPVSRGGEVGFKDRSQATLVVMSLLPNRDWVSILKHTGSGGASGNSGPVKVILLSHNQSRANHSLLILLGLLFFLLSESTFRAASSGLERTLPIAGKTSLCVLELRRRAGKLANRYNPSQDVQKRKSKASDHNYD